MKNFAMTGIAGYIAPRHLKAIKDTGNNLIAAVDPHDSVGILDQFFPEAAFFTEFERFDRHLEMLKRREKNFNLDYLSICSPNHLHDAHIRFALRIGADAICEKPLVLNPWNLDTLEALETEYGKKVFTILQLRVHPSIQELKIKLANKSNHNRRYQVDLKYITSRGLWYQFSWKGNIQKSGGIATNIGIHLFDLLIWLFGKVKNFSLELNQYNKIGGTLELENADINWFLSIDRSDLPFDIVNNNKSTFRSIKLDGKEVEFSEGFTDLHTVVYKEILSGKGFTIADSRPSIELVHRIRTESLKKH